VLLAGLTLGACSSDSDDNTANNGTAYTAVSVNEAPAWAIDWSHDQSAPDWQEPRPGDYEFWSVLLVQIEPQLQPFVADDDLMAVFIGSQLRGLSKPAVNVGNNRQDKSFLIKAYSNEGDKGKIEVTLKYYDAANKRILTFNNPIKKR